MTRVHTLVIGSGAAGLSAATQLAAHGVDDLLILTEGLDMGTSINAGSDKQTYYKLSLCGDEADSVAAMARTYFAGGSMHGDLALVEAGLSARAFMRLVELGVPFPRDEYGQFVGYKTDHDPRQRATSIGPYTSREMCRCLIRDVKRRGIPVREGRAVVELVVVGEGESRRVAGALALNAAGGLEAYAAQNVVFAVGGPAGLYPTSVYPKQQTGAIGLGLMAGASARNLSESQFGMASTRHRWNVSGSYMQVIPRFISRLGDDPATDTEFMRPYFDSVGAMNSAVFLKGYQWPFDAARVIGGSSLVDLLVYIETEDKGRRVFLDYRTNPAGFAWDELSAEAQGYLRRSNAAQDTPIARLEAMNPAAIDLYRDHDIDLATEPLEIAVCSQHNNGGLAANHWWESENIAHLFPVGEVNGSHGVKRPGGASLNAGQVGGIRAAEYIANRYAGWSPGVAAHEDAVREAAARAEAWARRCASAARTWREELTELQERMSRAGSHVRAVDVLDDAIGTAWAQARNLLQNGCRFDGAAERLGAFQARQLCFAHAVYLDAIGYAARSGVGSRGSAVTVDPAGRPAHPLLPGRWRIQPEDEAFRARALETVFDADGAPQHTWTPVRPLPQPDSWFETAWARYRSGDVYGPR